MSVVNAEEHFCKIVFFNYLLYWQVYQATKRLIIATFKHEEANENLQKSMLRLLLRPGSLLECYEFCKLGCRCRSFLLVEDNSQNMQRFHGVPSWQEGFNLIWSKKLFSWKRWNVHYFTKIFRLFASDIAPFFW